MRHTWWAGCALAVLLAFCRPMWDADGWIDETLEWIGYGGLVLCVLGRSWCSVYIGGRKSQTLVTTGPYSVARNPLYVFSFIGLAGIGALTGMVTFIAILVIIFAIYYRTVVRREEAVLTKIFGEPYAAYRARVPRWLPRFSLWRDAPEITVKPRFVLRAIEDSAWFFIAFPAIEALEYVQEAGLIPVGFTLP